MRFQPASREFNRMLTVQHLVKKYVGDGIFGHVRSVERGVDDDLIERRVENAQLAALSVSAPADS